MPGGRSRVSPFVFGPLPDLVGSAEPLAEQVRAHARLRWLTIVAIPAGALVGSELLGFHGLSLPGFLALAAAIAGYNTLLLGLLPDGGPRRRIRLLRHASVILDFLALTAGLWLVGGAGSPFLALYLVHVILSSMLLERREAFSHVALGLALYAGLAFGQWSGSVPIVGPPELAVSLAGVSWRVPVALVGIAGLLMISTAAVVRPAIDRLRAGERRLAALNDELRELARLRRDFLHITIHDLKAPIAAVRSILTAVRAGHAGPVNDDVAAWLERSLERLAGLSAFLRDLAVLADLDDRALRERADRVDLRELVEQVVDEHRDLAGPGRLEFVVDAGPGLPAVHGQPRLLREALANYLTNAVRHSPEGGTITVRLRATDDGVRVEVADEGPGIPEPQQKELFREFVRLAPAGGEGRAGGLGLSIVRRIVDLHGGKVGVRSRPGEGSVFWFELPLSGPNLADRETATS